jgi:60 kDa SS-A/Ro ribonucleoprotein
MDMTTKINKRASAVETTGIRLAGGMGAPAARSTEEDQLRRMVMTCLLWEDAAYIDGESIQSNIKLLIPKVPAAKVAAIAIAARKEQKLRHVPLLIIREMCRYESHRKFVRLAIKEVCTRADQVTDLLALYWSTNNGKKSIPKQMKLGIADALVNFDEYQLAKYNRSTEVKLVDAMRLTHPKPSDAELFKRLAGNTLATPDTWEVGLSAAKSDAEKAQVWRSLIENKKLGAVATLRNLRNMQAVLTKAEIRQAINQTSPAMLLPLDFIKAVKYAPDYAQELENLMFKCLGQFPKLTGETVFVLDVSGSMQALVSGKSEFTRMDVGKALVMLAREMCENCTVYLTATTTGKIANVRGFGISSEIERQRGQYGYGGIYTRQCLEHIRHHEKENPDRIIIFSDSQDCDPIGRKPQPFGKKNYIVDVSPHQHGVNYKGLWTAEISGWSENFFKFIYELENG